MSFALFFSLNAAHVFTRAADKLRINSSVNRALETNQIRLAINNLGTRSALFEGNLAALGSDSVAARPGCGA